MSNPHFLTPGQLPAANRLEYDLCRKLRESDLVHIEWSGPEYNQSLRVTGPLLAELEASPRSRTPDSVGAIPRET